MYKYLSGEMGKDLSRKVARKEKEMPSKHERNFNPKVTT